MFASVQTLAGRLAWFDPDEFDYVVVDEFHHASARTYRRVLDHFRPGFLLGLTATPERLDGADLLALCGDNLVFECNLVEGIDRGDLSTFDYFGILTSSTTPRSPGAAGGSIPMRSTDAVATQERAAAGSGRVASPRGRADARVLRHRPPRRLHGRVLPRRRRRRPWPCTPARPAPPDGRPSRT